MDGPAGVVPVVAARNGLRPRDPLRERRRHEFREHLRRHDRPLLRTEIIAADGEVDVRPERTIVGLDDRHLDRKEPFEEVPHEVRVHRRLEHEVVVAAHPASQLEHSEHRMFSHDHIAALRLQCRGAFLELREQRLVDARLRPGECREIGPISPAQGALGDLKLPAHDVVTNAPAIDESRVGDAPCVRAGQLEDAAYRAEIRSGPFENPQVDAVVADPRLAGKIQQLKQAALASRTHSREARGADIQRRAVRQTMRHRGSEPFARRHRGGHQTSSAPERAAPATETRACRPDSSPPTSPCNCTPPRRR